MLDQLYLLPLLSRVFSKLEEGSKFGVTPMSKSMPHSQKSEQPPTSGNVSSSSIIGEHLDHGIGMKIIELKHVLPCMTSECSHQ